MTPVPRPSPGRSSGVRPDWTSPVLLVVILAVVALAPALFLNRIPAQVDWLDDYTPWSDPVSRSEVGLPVKDVPPFNKYSGDSFLVYLPDRKFAVSEWKAGRWPLWNPYVAGGMSLMGMQTATPLDPLIVLMLVLPTGIALGLNDALLMVLAGAGMILLLREGGVKRGPALAAAGVGFALCPYFLVWMESRVFAGGLAALPLLLWSLERRRRVPGARWPLGVMALGVGYSALAGTLQTLAIVFLLVILRLVWLSWPSRGSGGEGAEGTRLAPGPCLLALACGVAVGSLSVLPGVEAFRQSTRAVTQTGYYHDSNFLHWRALSLWFNPELFGWTHHDSNLVKDVLGRTPTGSSGWGASGMVILLLAGLGLWSPETPRREKIFWGGLGGGVVLLLLLCGTPAYALLSAACPWIDSIDLLRGLVVTSLSAAVLAGWGAHDALCRWERDPGWRAWRRGVLIFAGSGAALIVAAKVGLPAVHVQWRDVAPPLLAAGVLLAVGSVALSPARRGWILVLSAGLELLTFHFRFNTFARPDYDYPEHPSLAYMREALGPPNYYRVAVTANWKILPPNLAELFRIFDVRAYTNVPVARYWTLLECAERTTFANHVTIENIGSPIYRLLGAAAVFSTEPIQDPLFIQVHQSLHARVDPLPRAFLVHDVRLADGPAEMKERLSHPAFDPLATAWMEAAAGPPPALGSPTRAESALIVTYEPDRVVIETAASAPAVMILADTYYPGWRARVDGKPARIYPIDYALRGVAVPAGASTVEFRYRPSWFWPGVVAGLLGLAGAGWVLLTESGFQATPRRLLRRKRIA